jgi:hypothetical protein
VYLALAVFLWWNVWTGGHPDSTMVCACGDPGSFAWFMAWPGYAISHGHGLFLATTVHVPAGMNMLDNTSVLALAVPLTPVTWLFGPVAALNVALTLAPAMSAMSAYASLRRALRVGRAAAFLGGLAFGFSPFVLRNEAVNHLQFTFLALLPLIFWCCYELVVARSGTWRRWGGALGLLVAAQFFVGVEMLTIAMLTTAAALILACAAALAGRLAARRKADPARAVSLSPGLGRKRARIGFAVRGFALGAGIAGVLLAYPLWYALAGPQHIQGPDWPRLHANGLASMLFPLPLTPVERYGLPITGYPGPPGQLDGYLGIPALAVLILAVVLVRRPLPKLGAMLTVIAAWLSLGTASEPLAKGGEPAWLWLPWLLFARIPELDKLNPANFTVVPVWFIAVAAALLVDWLWPARGRPQDGRPQDGRPQNGQRAVGLAAAPAGSGSGAAVAAAADGQPAALSGTPAAWSPRVRATAAAVIAAAVVIPWLLAWPLPYAVSSVATPGWMRQQAARLPARAVVLFYPFPSSYKDKALIWQAEGGMTYALVGGRGIVAAKSGHAEHGFTAGTPEGTMTALTTRHVPHVSSLSLPPMPGPAEVASFRQALRQWGVTNVIVTSGGRAPGYARRWLSIVIGAPPRQVTGALVWDDVQALLRRSPGG